MGSAWLRNGCIGCCICCFKMHMCVGTGVAMVLERALTRWGAAWQALSSRVRFMLRDILELRKSKWVPRRQKEEAKKISEIHAAAHAELGMMPAAMMPGLAPLPAQVRAGVPGLGGNDVELFPAFKTDGALLLSTPGFR